MSAVCREADSETCVIKKCTSSGLVNSITKNERGFLLSAEIYDVLLKALKSDEENATGDIVLCKYYVMHSTYTSTMPAIFRRGNILSVCHRKHKEDQHKHNILYPWINTSAIC